jgi:hypothetical protein
MARLVGVHHLTAQLDVPAAKLPLLTSGGGY